VGRAGQLEQAEEVRIETILPISRVEQVIAALKQAHPYEEPAFDLLQLAAPPEGRGQGRIANPRCTCRPLSDLRPNQERIGSLPPAHRRADHGHDHPRRLLRRLLRDILNDAIAQKAELYLTGEMRHHDALRAAQKGITVVASLHSNSERAVLKRLASRLRERLPPARISPERIRS